MTNPLIPANMERFLELTAQREQVVNANMANATTPGYSREIVNLSAAASNTLANGVTLGNGVSIDSITSVRDQLLDLRIQQQTSDESAASAQSTVLSSIENYFSGASGTVSSSLSAFFTSLSALSSAPSNAAARQTAISDAESVVNEFHATSNGLTQVQAGLDTQVAGDVTQINALTSQIASLNTVIAAQSSQPQSGSTAVDQRAELERQLATFTGISITNTAEGDTITTGNGTALVVASKGFALQAGTGANGLLGVEDSDGTDVTGTLTGGDLGGLLQVRDTAIPGFLSQLDALASGFGQAFNAAQSTGYDLAGNAGGALFTLPGTVAGSAAAIALRTTNGSAIAVSSDGSEGSNGNLNALTGVQSQTMANGASLTDGLATLTDAVGNAASQANTQSAAIQASLTQLGNQQSAVSGVSIDEESSNLIRFQQAYEAAAEVVTTIQSLFTTTLNMVSGGGA